MLSRNSTLLFAILAAAVFYGFFGIVVPEYLVSDAFHSIVPAMRVVAILIGLGLIAFSVLRLLKEGSE